MGHLQIPLRQSLVDLSTRLCRGAKAATNNAESCLFDRKQVLGCFLSIVRPVELAFNRAETPNFY